MIDVTQHFYGPTDPAEAQRKVAAVFNELRRRDADEDPPVFDY